MKTTGLILLNFYILGMGSADGQTRVTYRLGLTGGVNASQVATPSFKNTTSLLGRYNVGLALEQRFTPAVAFVYQVGYTRLGGSSKGNGINGTLTSITEYNYWALPIMLQIRPKGERGFIEAGGQAGYYLGGRSYTKGQKEGALSHQNITKLDAGLTGGLGYQLGKHLVIDARYYYGMRKIYADHSGPDPTTGAITFYRLVPQYHRAYILNLGYYF